MGQEAINLPSKEITLEELDTIILEIIEELSKKAIKGASECTDAVFRLSANYIDRPAFEALKKFYDLYFGEAHIEDDKNTINQDVDDLVEQIQSKIEDGESLDSVSEDESTKRKRLGLAAVQKQLEGLITLNAGIKTQVLPALSSMQFEDAVSQRVAHLVEGWQLIQKALFYADQSTEDIDTICKDLAKICSSVEETKDFYNLVLGEEPPEGEDNRSVFLEF